jgi:hypothetical protein
VCCEERIGLGFKGSGKLKKKNSSDGHDDVINARCYIRIIIAHRYCSYARRCCGYTHRYRLLKTEFRID